MDLKSYQRRMWFTLKKYLNLIDLKQDRYTNVKSLETEYLELLREIISIHEEQKRLISAMRTDRGSQEGVPVSRNSTSFSSPRQSTEDWGEREAEEEGGTNRPPRPLIAPCAEGGVAGFPLSPAPSRLDEKDHYALNLMHLENGQPSSYHSTRPLLCAGSRSDTVAFPESVPESEGRERNGAEEPPLSPQEGVPLDLHDLVTTYEFTQSLGLLTVQECASLLQKRRERHKNSGCSSSSSSHIFRPAIWEKHETKRKKRDWLLSSSPPQLRRQIRPGSQPPSRLPSRPSSPLERGSSSPPSSLSPPSPASPGGVGGRGGSSRGGQGICPVCKEKGACLQCDGCGVLFHGGCVVVAGGVVEGGEADAASSSSSSSSPPEWLCAKCEDMGVRAPVYQDPLHPRHHNKGEHNKGTLVDRGTEKERLNSQTRLQTNY